MDLNKLDTNELNQVKQEMDKDFMKKQLKPGDNGYEYDTRANFDDVEKVDGSWDEGIVSNDEVDDYFEDDFL